jgi:hypothetical protein
MGVQLGLGWNHKVVADGDVVQQFSVIDVADTDIIATLLDGRVGLNSLDALRGVTSEPVRGFDMPSDFHVR